MNSINTKDFERPWLSKNRIGSIVAILIGVLLLILFTALSAKMMEINEYRNTDLIEKYIPVFLILLPFIPIMVGFSTWKVGKKWSKTYLIVSNNHIEGVAISGEMKNVSKNEPNQICLNYEQVTNITVENDFIRIITVNEIYLVLTNQSVAQEIINEYRKNK